MSSIFAEAIFASINAMLKIIIVGAVGMYSAYAGYLTPSFKTQLSTFTFMLVTPCLGLSNLAKQLSVDQLGLYWPMLVWSVYSILASYGIGFLYTFFFKSQIRAEYSSTIVSAVAYSNAVSFPIVIFDSLCKTSIFPDPTAFEQASSLIFLSSVPWNLIMFILGYPYLTGIDTNNNNDNSDENTDDDSDPVISTDINDLQINDPTTTHIQPLNTLTEAQMDQLPIEEDPRYPEAPLLTCCGLIASRSDQCCDATSVFMNKHILSKCRNSLRFVLVMMFTNPPTVAIFLGIIIGVVAPLRQSIFEPGGSLIWLGNAISFISLAAIPLGQFVTFANIYHSIQCNFGPDARLLRRTMDILERIGSSNTIIIAQPEQPQSQIQPQKPQQSQYPPSPLMTSQFHRDQSTLSQHQHYQRNLVRDRSSIIKQSPYIVPVASTLDVGMENDDDITMLMGKSALIRRNSSYLGYSHSQYINETSANGFAYHDQPVQFQRDHSGFIPQNSSQYLSNAQQYTDYPHSMSNLNNLNNSQQNNTQNSYIDPFAMPNTILEATESTDSIGKNINNNNNNNAHKHFQHDESASNNTTPQTTTQTTIIPPDLPIEYDENGKILPLPRLSWLAMLMVSICRLIMAPLVVYLTMLLVDALGWVILLPQNTLYRTNILLMSASTSAESVLMIVTKALRVRQSMALSLVYVCQYAMCLITIPIWLVIVISTNQFPATP